MCVYLVININKLYLPCSFLNSSLYLELDYYPTPINMKKKTIRRRDKIYPGLCILTNLNLCVTSNFFHYCQI